MPPLGEGIPPLGAGIPPLGGDEELSLQPTDITPATAITSSGLSQRDEVRVMSLSVIQCASRGTILAAIPLDTARAGSGRYTRLELPYPAGVPWVREIRDSRSALFVTHLTIIRAFCPINTG